MVLRLLYGLEDGYRHTWYEVAHNLGLAGERIRQLEAMAMTRLGENSSYFMSLLDYTSDDNQLQSKPGYVPNET
jgi:DNA-directed RNA polymerase sigma subunit (sigma70/sigma32)